MKRFLTGFLPLWAFIAQQMFAGLPQGEYVFVVGAPSLMIWEQAKPHPHDHWWANFVRAARIRTEQIRAQSGPKAKITWLVYAQGYEDRAKQEGQDLLGHIASVRDKYGLNLIYFDKGDTVINYLMNGQPREILKVADFEYFGHSNAHCFMFDYSNNIDTVSRAWLHETDLIKLSGRIFTRGAFAKSWGCHTGESMSQKWYAATGVPLWGVIGKTEYMADELPVAVGENARWVAR